MTIALRTKHGGQTLGSIYRTSIRHALDNTPPGRNASETIAEMTQTQEGAHDESNGFAVVTGVVPSPPRYVPSFLVAHRVRHSHCSSMFIECF